MLIRALCRSCQRQHDVSDRRPGTKFRCVCGETIAVPEPRSGLEMRVVRCSSCGGPREDENSPNCAYCGGSLTLHERDLNTVCAHCLTRISDVAKFCHACGGKVSPTERMQFRDTGLVCPECGTHGQSLQSRQVADGAPAVLECPWCVGMWLTWPQLETLIKNTKDISQIINSLAHAGNAVGHTERPRTGSGQFGSFRYRPCPECQKMMNRVNFGRSSGVIVDVCKAHGIWFDDDELRQVLAWFYAGGAAAQLRKETREAVQARINGPKSVSADEGQTASSWCGVTWGGRGDVVFDVLLELLKSIV